MDQDSKKPTYDLIIVLVAEAPRPTDVMTSSTIKSRGPSRAYDAGWDRVFGDTRSASSSREQLN